MGLFFAYSLIVYLTFHAVAKVYRTHDPLLAKKVVVITFLIDIVIFAGSGYLVYKLKVPPNKNEIYK